MSTTTTTPSAPTRDELSKAWNALADVYEEHVDPLAKRVFALANAEAPRVRFEDIGALLCSAHELRAMLGYLEGTLEKVEQTALEDLSVIARDGELGHVPQFDEEGGANFIRERGEVFLSERAAEHYFPESGKREGGES
ncbi:MAG: hypothetical protein ACRDNE_11980 [Gaiellaceae bacterium]